MSDSVYRRRRAAVIAAVALLAILTIVVLASLNGGGKPSVDVPDVVGRPVAEARTQLEGGGLKAKVTEQDRAGPADRVAAQNPIAGGKAPRGSTVELFVPRSGTSTTASTVAPATTASTRATTTTVAPVTTAATVAATTVAPPTTSILVPTTAAVTTTSR